MKKTLFILLLIASILFVSCDIFGEGESFFDSLKDDTPDSSEMFITFCDKNESTRAGVYQMDFDKDDTSLSTESYVINCKHLKGDKECDYGWTFQSDDLKLNNITDKGCAIDCTQLKGLGTYTVKAKSEVSEELDKIFIINATSALSEIVLDYQIQDAYKKSGLEYTDQMLSGTINRFTKEITLTAGAVYDFTVRDASENNLPISTITVNKTNDCITTREIYDNTFRLVCKQYDNQSSTMTVRIGSSSIYLTVKVNLKDIAKSELHEVDIVEDTESIISLVKNPSTDPDKTYTYQIKTNAVLSDRVLKFSIDYYNWDRTAEEGYCDTPYYEPSKNSNPHWLQYSVDYNEFEGSELFKIEFDGQTGTFSIIPRNDTVFFHSTTGEEKNLHCYLYVRYAEDDDDINSGLGYRYRWRIMIGGKLEKLEMYTVDPTSNNAKKLEGDIAIKEGDTTGWVFRANYVPATTENRETIWYLSGSKTVEKWERGAESFYAPKPLSMSDTDKSKQKVVNFMQCKEEEYHLPGSGDFTNAYGEKFIIYKYWLDKDVENGYSDLWTTYNSLGHDVVIVALNLETKMYTSVAIKDLGDKQIIIKSLSKNSKSLVNGKSTGYEADNQIQEYPNTIVAGYENYRTFYMDVEETMKIQILSTFKMTELDAFGDSDARDIFPTISADLEDQGLSGTIKLQTLYMMLADMTPEDKEKCLSPDGVNIRIRINNEYDARLRIIVYDKEKN